MLEDIYDCQNYLQAKGINYNISLSFGFYTDHSERRLWNTHRKTIDDSKYMQNPIYSKVFNSIDHDKLSPSINKGYWEYLVDKSKVLELFNSKIDLHPSTLCQFYFLKHISSRYLIRNYLIKIILIICTHRLKSLVNIIKHT